MIEKGLYMLMGCKTTFRDIDTREIVAPVAPLIYPPAINDRLKINGCRYVVVSIEWELVTMGPDDVGRTQAYPGQCWEVEVRLIRVSEPGLVEPTS